MKPITTNSAVEFLAALLVAASVIAIVAKRLRLPYTVALVVGGLMLSWIRLPHLSPLVPGQRPDWLTPDIILFLFLPALVFEGSLKLQALDLQHDAASFLLLANFGVLVAARVTGYVVHWAIGLPLLIAFLFGAIISATDPISVLAIFKDLRMDNRLSVVVEGESLLNDGTAAALFQILSVFLRRTKHERNLTHLHQVLYFKISKGGARRILALHVRGIWSCLLSSPGGHPRTRRVRARHSGHRQD